MESGIRIVNIHTSIGIEGFVVSTSVKGHIVIKFSFGIKSFIQIVGFQIIDHLKQTRGAIVKESMVLCRTSCTKILEIVSYISKGYDVFIRCVS